MQSISTYEEDLISVTVSDFMRFSLLTRSCHRSDLRHLSGGKKIGNGSLEPRDIIAQLKYAQLSIRFHSALSVTSSLFTLLAGCRLSVATGGEHPYTDHLFITGLTHTEISQQTPLTLTHTSGISHQPGSRCDSRTPRIALNPEPFTSDQGIILTKY